MENEELSYEINEESIVVNVPEEVPYDGFVEVNVSLGSGASAGRSGCCSC